MKRIETSTTRLFCLQHRQGKPPQPKERSSVWHRFRLSNVAKLLLPLVALLTFSASVHAQTGTTANGLVYSASNNQIAITSCLATVGEVNIPDTISVSGSDLPVTSIGNGAFDACYYLTSVTIPSGAINIGDRAFRDCMSLTGVSIPDGVTNIGTYAFDGCTSLTSVSIPSSVTSIGELAFKNCTSLTSITVAASNPFYCSSLDGVLFDKNQTMLIKYPAKNQANSYAIPSGVTSIGPYAFESCKSLSTVIVPSSVTSIGDYPFSWTFPWKVIFAGNAPSMNTGFTDAWIWFTARLYYFDGAAGFNSDPYIYYETVNMGVSSPLKSWLLSKGFAHDADLQSSPNGDCVSLLMAYALNLDPTRNQSRNIPRPVLSGSNLSLTYYAGSEGVTYSVETSTDLQNWVTTEVILSGPDGSGCYTATAPMTGAKKFMRLKVWR